MLHRFIMRETYLAEQIKSEKGEHHNPYGKVNLPVEDTPVVCLVCNAEEFESERDLHEAENDLH